MISSYKIILVQKSGRFQQNRYVASTYRVVLLSGFIMKSRISFFFFKQVHQVATDQVFETFSHLGHKKSLPALRNAAASGSSGQLESLANVFTQDAKRLQEVSEHQPIDIGINGPIKANISLNQTHLT